MASTINDTKPEISVQNSSSPEVESGSTALSSVANPQRVRWNSTN